MLGELEEERFAKEVDLRRAEHARDKAASEICRHEMQGDPLVARRAGGAFFSF